MMAQIRFALLTSALAIVTMLTVNCSSGSNSDSAASGTPAYTQYGVSCGSGLITSQYGCLPQCNANGYTGVMRNNQCVQVTNSTTSPTYNQTGYGYGTGNIAQCRGSCPEGQTQMQPGVCLPKWSCGDCYGFSNNECFIGQFANQYYFPNGGYRPY